VVGFSVVVVLDTEEAVVISVEGGPQEHRECFADRLVLEAPRDLVAAEE